MVVLPVAPTSAKTFRSKQQASTRAHESTCEISGTVMAHDVMTCDSDGTYDTQIANNHRQGITGTANQKCLTDVASILVGLGINRAVAVFLDGDNRLRNDLVE